MNHNDVFAFLMRNYICQKTVKPDDSESQTWMNVAHMLAMVAVDLLAESDPDTPFEITMDLAIKKCVEKLNLEEKK